MPDSTALKMQYVGLARIVMVRMRNLVFEPDDERAMDLEVSVLIKDGSKDILVDGLRMSVVEYGEIPQVGYIAHILIKNKKILIVE